ncbi:Type I transmembrane sorting receptor [Beauveria asiatica]|uniref:Type I transmembrane sorting receptor n=1 Tax=Beauveria asiatica TaxID=1069075 RepID=A0AAW0RI18_9HYPO
MPVLARSPSTCFPPLRNAAAVSLGHAHGSKGRFTVDAKYNPNFKKTPHPSNALGRRANGGVTAYDSPSRPDVEYYARVDIGTPAQTMNLLFDTGSSDLWVFVPDTSGTIDDGQGRWNVSASSSASRIDGGSWSIGYGDGSGAKGTLYDDTVSVAGIAVTQGVEVATSISHSRDGSAILGSPVSGIVGFGFDGGNTGNPQQKTLFTNMLSKLDSPVFTVDLKHGADGTFDFGFIDSNKYTGDISYGAATTNDYGWWLWTASGYAVGNGDFVELDMQGIVDTGNPSLTVPGDAFSAYTDVIPNYSKSFDCSTTLPDLYIGVGGGNTIKVDGEHLKGTSDDGSCGHVLGSGTPAFGSPAMAGAFLVFERGTDGDKGARIGWANFK